MVVFYNKGLIKEEIDFKSFEVKDELCPDIFHDNSMIKREVRESLLKMADDFYDFLQLDWVEGKYTDVWLVGSMASYNWSEIYSDIDLHVVIDYSKITDNQDLLENDMWALKTTYNSQHELKIMQYDVELYAQDINEKIESNGIYSVLKQTWIRKPSKIENVSYDKRRVSKYVSNIETEIEKAIKQYRLGNHSAASKIADEVDDTLMNLRKNGLNNGGEFSDENIAFKALRRNGSIDKLKKVETLAFDKSVSIEPSNKQKLETGQITPRPAPDAPVKSGGTKQDDEKKDEVDDDEKYNDGITYVVSGRKFSSLRDAETELGIPKSTIEYRINSESPKWSSYKKKIG